MAKVFSWKLLRHKDVLGNFVKVAQGSKDRSRDIARQAGELLVQALKEEAPIGIHYRITGDGVTEERPETLKKSLKFRTFAKPWGVELKIYAAEHVKFVINDTKGHWIRARNAPALTFYWPNAPAEVVEHFGGNIVHFKQVWHPGTKANPFHQRALKSVRRDFQQILQHHAGKVKRDLEA